MMMIQWKRIIHYFIYFSYHNSTRICCLCNKSQRQKIHVSAFAAAFLSQLKFFCHKDITWTGLTREVPLYPEVLISGWRFATSGVTILMKNPKNLATYLLLYCKHTVPSKVVDIRQNLKSERLDGAAGGGYHTDLSRQIVMMSDWARHFWYLKESKVPKSWWPSLIDALKLPLIGVGDVVAVK